ncbi:lysylphosphatidylglycerol synthase domain-containing protein [Acidihalobacter ferrooxydans]|uniref:TIGR00374 family protein n=1 Tax=Acidihalobacter ferrooxydans TaxID=1765967 RepID=A0A1P8UFA1_9GAMM|nr:lysylphosphatidylglycerol synthase domain-containing protein [Acidihalobacter ferrooxydans]APZ42469.1 hypothetical protein BW247_04675 [Acidihalobacter ferrooxydans]
MNAPRRLWRVLAQPKIALPLLLTAGLLAAAAGLSDLPLVFERIGQIPIRLLLLTLLLAAAYLLLKAVQFHYFLHDLGIPSHWRNLSLAYAIGELTLAFPMGIYAQNYLLLRLNGSRPSRSAAATTLMLMLETAMLLFTLALTGVRGWPWLRLAAIGCLLGLIAFLALITRSHRLRRAIAGALLRLHLPVRPYLHFVRSLRILSSGAALLRHGYLTALYLAALIGAFYVIAHGVGVPQISVHESAGIYAFSLTAALLLGSVTSQLGVVEVAGMGAAHAFGFDYTEGLAMLLGFRLVWTACIWLLCLPVVLRFKRDLNASPPT